MQLLWANANRQAHALFLKLINDGGDSLSTTGGAVTLNLGTIVDQLGSQLGVDVSGKLPPDAAQIQLVKSDQLSTAQDLVKALKGLSLILPLIALALYALAVYLARGWRREAVRAWGVSWIVIGLLVLVVRSLAGTAVVDSLASTESVKPAVNATWDIGTSLLRDGGIAMLGYGIVIFFAAVLAGPLSIAQRTRRSLAPLLRDRPSAYATVAVIVLLLLWWSPTEGFRRLLPSLVLFGLLIAGVEALRHQTNREYPDETWADVRDRWAGGFSNLRHGSGQETASAAGPASGRLDDLERLTGLRDSGVFEPGRVRGREEAHPCGLAVGPESPINHRWKGIQMADRPVFLYAAIYDEIGDAEADYEAVFDLHAAGAIGTFDSAVIRKEEDGKVRVTKTEKPTQHGAWTGAGVGALVGILFPPAIIGSAIVGAGAGGLVGHLRGGISRDDLKELGDELRGREAPR